MSNLRDKAREIKAAGEAERGNFEPSGTPLRVYNYWLNNSKSHTANSLKAGVRGENFCHFWRVVVIWAGLLAVGRSFERFLESKIGMVLSVLAGLLAVYALLNTAGILGAVLIALASTAAIAALVTGAYFLHKRFWNNAWNDTLATVLLVAFGVIVAGLVISMLVLAVIDFGLIVLPLIVAGVAAFLGVIWGLASLSEFISGRRALRRKAQRAAWEEARSKFLAGEGPDPYEVEPSEPGRIKKFFSTLADFLILITQIVRVKKWKICPMVDIQA